MDTIPEWIREVFAELNERHFHGRLRLPFFALAELNGSALYVPEIHMIKLTRSTLARDRKLVTDAVLHQMVHYALDVDTGAAHQEHGDTFVALANQIGVSLDLPRVEADSADVVIWPRSVRPPAYYPRG
jgi:hypothetical protein